MTKALLAAGARVNEAHAAAGWEPPLHAVVGLCGPLPAGDPENDYYRVTVMKALIAAGADRTAKNPEGKTPLEVATGLLAGTQEPFYRACYQGEDRRAQELAAIGERLGTTGALTNFGRGRGLRVGRVLLLVQGLWLGLWPRKLWPLAPPARICRGARPLGGSLQSVAAQRDRRIDADRSPRGHERRHQRREREAGRGDGVAGDVAGVTPNSSAPARG